MGKMEERNRKRAAKENLQKIILGTIAVAGVLSLAIVAPNALGAMAKLGIIPQKRHGQSINRARDRLIKKGWLIRQSGLLRLTRKGEAALRHMELYDFGNRKPSRWDRKWRVLIFDVPEYRKGLRDKIRRTLMAVGFTRLQDSVWVYPYDCEDLMALLKADFKIGRDMRYLIVDQIEGDATLKAIFGLEKYE